MLPLTFLAKRQMEQTGGASMNVGGTFMMWLPVAEQIQLEPHSIKGGIGIESQNV